MTHWRKQPCRPDAYTAFWEASRDGRELFDLSPEAASDEKIIENQVDLDGILSDFTREEVKAVLFDLYDKAHRVLMCEPAMKPETQACFRELAFWNTIRILAGFNVDDMAKSSEQARRAKHADAVWPMGMSVRMQGESNFRQAKELLPSAL